jgi:hypothetical protein
MIFLGSVAVSEDLRRVNELGNAAHVSGPSVGSVSCAKATAAL